MSDDHQESSFDGCECVFSHEFAMRRLLSMLRSGQAYCTDTECADLTNPHLRVSDNGDSSENFTWLMFMMFSAAVLYLIRPNSLRRTSGEGSNKPVNDVNDVDQPPPPSI